VLRARIRAAVLDEDRRALGTGVRATPRRAAAAASMACSASSLPAIGEHADDLIGEGGVGGVEGVIQPDLLAPNDLAGALPELPAHLLPASAQTPPRCSGCEKSVSNSVLKSPICANIA
jgi:hypothetical protein